MSTRERRAEVSFEDYSCYLDGTLAGVVDNGGIRPSIAMPTRDISDVEGQIGIYKQYGSGVIVDPFELSIMQLNMSAIRSRLLNGRTPGDTYGQGLDGNYLVVDDVTDVEVYLKHPSDRMKDITLHKCNVGGTLALNLKSVDKSVLTLTVQAKHDCSKPAGERMGWIGDYASHLAGETLNGILFFMDKNARAPLVGLPSLSLEISGVDRVRPFAVRLDTDYSTTGLLNEAAFSATQTTINLDGIADGTKLVAGSIVEIGTTRGVDLQYVYVTSVTWNDAGHTDATIVGVRKSVDQVAYVDADDTAVVIYEPEGIYLYDITNIATATSADPTDVLCGDTAYAESSADKFVLTWMDTDAGTLITATSGSFVSYGLNVITL